MHITQQCIAFVFMEYVGLLLFFFLLLLYLCYQIMTLLCLQLDEYTHEWKEAFLLCRHDSLSLFPLYK